MSDLRPSFDRLAGDVPNPLVSDLDADIARGMHAVHVRRTRVIGAGLGLALMLGGVGFGLSQTGGPDDRPAIAAPSVQSPKLTFVAYTGDQPAGFSVDTVPDGWHVDSVNEYSLLITPPDLNTGPDDFIGKLLVSLESLDAHETPGDEVSVGGETGWLNRAEEGYGQLRWTDAKGNRMYVQWPTDAGWTDKEMTDFAAGIKVLGAAKPTRG